MGITIFKLKECKECMLRFDCPMIYITRKYIDSALFSSVRNGVVKEIEAAIISRTIWASRPIDVIRDAACQKSDSYKSRSNVYVNTAPFIEAYIEDELWV